jgi:hypothetical protein
MRWEYQSNWTGIFDADRTTNAPANRATEARNPRRSRKKVEEARRDSHWLILPCQCLRSILMLVPWALQDGKMIKISGEDNSGV